MKSTLNRAALLLMILTSTVYSQMADNWKWLNPSPQGNTLFAVDFVDNSTGYAAGNYGTILKTTDAGTTWNQLVSGTSQKLISMNFVNSMTGYVGGQSQLLRKTTDGGQTWQNLQLPVQGQWDTAYAVRDIQFVSPGVGYAAGFFLMESKIWKTTDGGTSWTVLSTGGLNYVEQLYFLDANTGFNMGGPTYGQIGKTTDGGNSWQLVGQFNYIVYSMSFINSTTGVAGCSDGRIYRTVDGGNTWNFALCPSAIDVKSIKFIDENTGFGFGTGSVYIKTTDGGANWDEFAINTGSIRLYSDADVTPNGNIHAVGTYGAMIRSTNSGASFVSQPFVTEHTICNIKFVNPTTGYAVAGFGAGDILKTTNAGETWVSQVSSYTLPLYGISFLNEQTGYLAGSINLKKTTNGGTNWQDVYTSTTNEIFTDIFFTNLNTGYASGTYGKLLKTTNAGATWNPSVITIPGTLVNSLYFVNDNTGFAVGDYNSAVKTTDGGASWTAMNVTSGVYSNNDVFFSDANTGYISSSSGLFKTTTGGAAWFAMNVPAGGYNNVQFRGNFGYAAAGNGKIIKTIDGGNNWIVQPTVTDNPLYALFFNSDDYVYAGGSLGTIMKTIPTELFMTPVTGNSNGTPKGFYLQQNYPNPFNPVTTIKFGITKAGQVNIKVFDITGRQAQELVNTSMSPGAYEVKWDGSSFSSGIYFYTIRTNEFSETKKMILVK